MFDNHLETSKTRQKINRIIKGGFAYILVRNLLQIVSTVGTQTIPYAEGFSLLNQKFMSFFYKKAKAPHFCDAL